MSGGMEYVIDESAIMILMLRITNEPWDLCCIYVQLGALECCVFVQEEVIQIKILTKQLTWFSKKCYFALP